MATIAGSAGRADPFWERMALGLALFILIGFAQFALRGLADPIAAPFWVHFHALAMLGWLALLVVQPRLIARGSLDLHRRVGRIGALLAILVTGLSLFVGVAAIASGRVPPFFAPPYFLALTLVEALAFGAMVGWAVRRRHLTDWHRRLMLGAAIVILEPALGRLLPMPLMVGWWDVPIGLVQLLAVGIIAMHDRRTLGQIHPATLALAMVVIAVRVTIYVLAMTPPFQMAAARLTGG